MPTTSARAKRPEHLITRLSSTDGQTKLKALRELKNQIIGNRTKKISYVKLGAVPAVVSILSAAVDSSNSFEDFDFIIQSAATIGSFACGVDVGVKAVLDAGALPLLFRLVSNSNEKVVDASARSLKMIYQSELAPKYDFLQPENLEFLMSLLNSESDNVTGLGASIITHSCQTSAEQKVLCDVGVLKKLQILLGGSINQRDAGFESLTSVIKNNPSVISVFAQADDGKVLRTICELATVKFPRTRLLACICLTAVLNTSPSYLPDEGLKTKLISILLELLDDPGQVGDEAPFALIGLIAEKEDAQNLAFEAGAIDKLCSHLQSGTMQIKRLEGVFLLLAELCSKLEICRSRIISLQVLPLVRDALLHDSAKVRIAACIFLRSVSRSVKSLSAGLFMNEMILNPLVQLLNDSSSHVQVAALCALGNIVVEFTSRKPTLIQCGGLKQLVHLSKSMDSSLRLNAVWALRNLTFLADRSCKEEIYLELTPPTLLSLICDHEPSVQEQALGFVRNLVDGSVDSIGYLFTGDGILLRSIGKQLQSSSTVENCIQGMHVLSNAATGDEFHKEAVLHQLLQPSSGTDQSVLIKFLQSFDSRLRTATIWSVVNITFPSSPGASSRFVKLRNAGVYSQIKNMVNDPCLDVKLRVRTALGQALNFDGNSS